MKAARIEKFGGPEVVVVADVARPRPANAEVLVRVAAAGVGPWDALIREGKSKVSPPPPLTLGSDLSGVIEETGPGVSQFKTGDEVYGVTNPQFVGAQAEYAVASANMIALKPLPLSHPEAASVPIVAVTAWQMLHDHAHVQAGQTVLILGAAGNVGAYAFSLRQMPDSMSLRSWVQKILNTCGGLGRKRLSITTAETLNLPCARWMSSLIPWAEIREIVRYMCSTSVASLFRLFQKPRCRRVPVCEQYFSMLT